MSSDDTSNDYDNIDAESLIEAFGGIRPMAQKLDVAVSTIQGWKARNHIPPTRIDEVISAAKSEGIDVASLTAPETIEGDAIILDDQSSESPKASMDKATLKNEDVKNDPKPKPKEKPTPVAASAPEARGGSSIAWLALVLVVVLGAAVFSRPVWAPIVDPKVGPYFEEYLPMMAHHQEGAHHGAGEMGDEHMAVVNRITALEEASTNDAAIDDILARISALEENPTSNPVVNTSDATGSAIDALDDRLIALEENRQSADGSSDNQATVDLSGINQKLAALESAQVALENANAAADADEAIAGLSLSLSQVENLASELNTKLQMVEQELAAAMARPTTAPGQKAAALVVSVSQLEGDALSGQAYVAALRNVKALSQNEEAVLADIEALEPYADDGVATRLELNRRFAALAPDADAAYRKANAEDWLDETLENIRGLVSIRRIGDDPDLPPVSRIEAALDRGDLAVAVAAAGEISDSELVASWLIDAQARLSVEQALLGLRATAIDMLADANMDTGADQ